MNQIYLLARIYHRALIWLIIGLGLAMSVTGILLKYGENFYPLEIRQIHNFLSPFFAVSLLVMMITGLVMYVWPKIIAHQT